MFLDFDAAVRNMVIAEAGRLSMDDPELRKKLKVIIDSDRVNIFKRQNPPPGVWFFWIAEGEEYFHQDCVSFRECVELANLYLMQERKS